MATASPASDRYNGTGDGKKGYHPCADCWWLLDRIVYCPMQWRGLPGRAQSAGSSTFGIAWIWLPRALQPDLHPAVGGDPHRRVCPPDPEPSRALEFASQRMGSPGI